ncbi:uncharacterized protein tp53i13 [Menidia menidia]
MPSQTRSPPLAVAVLVALWVGTPGTFGSACDNGKLSVDRDLPADAVYPDCGVAAWPESPQMLPSIDTAYEPEPARTVCMDKPISYAHTIPNSGAFRPVRAESGEYVYCPPQRWLNNLHNGDTVLLHHPCAPPHERQLLSRLARSCLPSGYILTPHPQLNTHRPIALVSWGLTLELDTAASLDVCAWLQATQSRGSKKNDVAQTMKYDLLLTSAAGLREPEAETKMKGSLRQCCEKVVSSLLRGSTEAQPTAEEERSRPEESKSREIRAAVGEGGEQSSAAAQTRHNGSSLLGSLVDSSTGKKNSSDPSFQKPELRPGIQKLEDFTHRPTAGFASVQTEPAGSRTSPSAKQSRKEKRLHEDQDGSTKQNEAVEVKEREVQQKQKPSAAHTPHKSPNAGPEPASRTQPPRPAGPEQPLPGAVAGRTSGAESGAESGLPRTPRTDEAVWAAAALGFLLVLLTLSVLHTRLYRHWRTTPSLYWHDPRQDYDSVADVIRRRLRISKRRRKRSRRQECALLPSSSSSDDYL